jgi:hypothetical protein
MWFTGGQKDKSVIEKQVGYRVSLQSPYRVWSQSQETLQSLAEGYICDTFELAESCL